MSWKIKLPKLRLEDGGECLMVHARVIVGGAAQVSCFFKDGSYRTISMTVDRVERAAKYGPFMHLVEGGDDSPVGLGLVDPDGNRIA